MRWWPFRGINMRLLITGGAGFIGSQIAHRLAHKANYTVSICDRFGQAEDGKWSNLLGLPLADIIAPEGLLAWLESHWRSVDAVLHMGAISSTEVTDVDRLIEQNFRVSRDLWDWCASRQIRLIYASSAAVYGDGAQGFQDENLQGAAALRPLNPYGWSKLLFDHYALAAQGRGASPPAWAGLRFFNVYGHNEGHKGGQASVAWQMLQRARAGQPLQLFRSHRAGIEDGAQARDFVWVGDCVEVIAWLLEAEISAGVLNVGTGTARSYAELAKAVQAATKTQVPIAWIDTPQALRATYQYHTQADISRLRQLGYLRAFTSLEAGLAAYAQAIG